MLPADRIGARELLTRLGRELEPAQVEAFWAAVKSARLRRDIRKASRPPKAEILKQLRQTQALAKRLRTALKAPHAQQRVGSAELSQEIEALIARVDEQEAQIAAHELDLGSPPDNLIREDLAAAARHLGIEATAPGDPPAGPYVEFVWAVFDQWGDHRPTAAAIKSSLYRRP